MVYKLPKKEKIESNHLFFFNENIFLGPKNLNLRKNMDRRPKICKIKSIEENIAT